MTLHEVKAATANLVFAEELADLDSVAEAGFYRALSRSIWVTDGLRPTRRIITLSHTPPYADSCEVGASDVLYDLRSLSSDIASLTEPPARPTEEGYLPLSRGYVLSGSHHLYLSRSIAGEVRLTCRIRPFIPDETTPPETPLSLDEELCQLLPLLTAHYLLLDDDTDKANHYLALFREQYALLATAASVPAPTAWRSVNHW